MPKPVQWLPTAHAPGRVDEALRFIASLEGSKHLSTEADREIFALLEEYRLGKQRFTVVLATFIPGHPKGALGYSCQIDKYRITPVEVSIPSLAMAIYHEMRHATQCRELMKKYGLADRRDVGPFVRRQIECETEEHAYAAQVRFMLAMISRKKMPKVASANKTTGDGQLYALTRLVWYKIHEGTFCDLYGGRKPVEAQSP
jgi:hypothetical protein